MKTRELLFILFIITGLLLVAGCSQPAQQSENNGQTIRASVTTPAPAAPSGMVTPPDLTARVKEAVAFARENGRDKAVAAFNDPTNRFAQDSIYVFAEDYNGTALAEPFEH